MFLMSGIASRKAEKLRGCSGHAAHLSFVGLCSYTVLGFSMMEAAMTVSQLGKDLSSCLHSSCMTRPHSPGPAAAGSTSHDSSSKSSLLFSSLCACTRGRAGCHSLGLGWALGSAKDFLVSEVNPRALRGISNLLGCLGPCWEG